MFAKKSMISASYSFRLSLFDYKRAENKDVQPAGIKGPDCVFGRAHDGLAVQVERGVEQRGNTAYVIEFHDQFVKQFVGLRFHGL